MIFSLTAKVEGDSPEKMVKYGSCPMLWPEISIVVSIVCDK